jgi:hypothetical protein
MTFEPINLNEPIIGRTTIRNTDEETECPVCNRALVIGARAFLVEVRTVSWGGFYCCKQHADVERARLAATLPPMWN